MKTNGKSIRVVLITNIPAPYREKIHEIISNEAEFDYYVIYCKELESNRQWKFVFGSYDKIILKGFSLKFNNRDIHFNRRVIHTLNLLNPDVVITSGFQPTMLLAFIWSYIMKKKHITFTDATIHSEKKLSFIHKFLRNSILKRTNAFIGASKKSLEWYKGYGINKNLFISNLCIDNHLFSKYESGDKQFDIMFSGQFIERKMPLFFVEVAYLIKKKLGFCKTLIIGSGYLKNKIIAQLQKYKIEYEYPGFIQQSELPKYYANSKLLLFPSLSDPWGIVANEACAVGTPVITCKNTGVANELVIHGENGYVLPLEKDIWTNHAIKLLENKKLYEKFSKNALESVQEYNYQNAAQGIIDTIKQI